jgi:hypothetical protein
MGTSNNRRQNRHDQFFLGNLAGALFLFGRLLLHILKHAFPIRVPGAELETVAWEKLPTWTDEEVDPCRRIVRAIGRAGFEKESRKSPGAGYEFVPRFLP